MLFRRLRCVALLCIGVLVAVSASAPAGAAPMHRHPVLWAAQYSGPPGSDHSVGGLGVSPDGTLVYVTGTSNYTDYTTLAYDSDTGARVWLAKARNGWQASGLAVSPDGTRVFVTGSSFSSDPQRDVFTVAYDARTGEQLWTARYGGNADQYGLGLEVSPDGTQVYVAAQYCCSSGLQDYLMLAYEAATGAGPLWVAAYDSGHNDFAYVMAESLDGSALYVSGWSGEPANQNEVDFVTVGVDTATGHLKWAARYDGGHSDVPRGVAVTPDGSRIIVTGNSPSSDYDDDYATIAYDDHGVEQWVATYIGPVNSWDYPFGGVAISPDGATAFVTGDSSAHGNTGDWATVAYDVASGAERWVARQDDMVRLVDNGALAMAVSSDGSMLFVTGQAEYSRQRGFDVLTLVYDPATGARLGGGLFHDPNQDQPFRLALAPDGSRVYVTGDSDTDPDPFGYDYEIFTLGYDVASLLD